MKVKSESEVAQSCPTLSDPRDYSPPGPLSMGFSRQEYWSGEPVPSPKYTWVSPLIFLSNRPVFLGRREFIFHRKVVHRVPVFLAFLFFSQKAKILVGLILWWRGDQGEHYPEDGRERLKKTGVAHKWEKKEMGWWPITRNTARTGMKISKNNGLISRTPGKVRLWLSYFQHNQDSPVKLGIEVIAAFK